MEPKIVPSKSILKKFIENDIKRIIKPDIFPKRIIIKTPKEFSAYYLSATIKRKETL